METRVPNKEDFKVELIKQYLIMFVPFLNLFLLWFLIPSCIYKKTQSYFTKLLLEVFKNFNSVK